MAYASYDVTIILAPLWNVREPWTAPAYLCESLRGAGYRVQYLDYNVRLYRLCDALGVGHLWRDDAYFRAWVIGELNFLAHLIDVDEIQGRIIGISTTHTNISFSIALSELIRDRFPQRKIIFGGHEVFFPQHAARVPLAFADAICKGEGEEVIREIVGRDFQGLESVPGLYLRDGRDWRLNAERPEIRDLDRIAWPRFEEIAFDQYEKRFLPLMGSRGCIGRCIFCTDRCRTPGFRLRSPNNQVDELEFLSANFNVEHFPYNDSLLNGHLKRLDEKCDEILRRGLKIRYGGNLMVREDMPSDLFPKLARSGFCVALIGVESGSATTLKSMRKRHTPEVAAAFVQNCHEAGIRTELNFMVGFPTETEEHFEETLEFLRKSSPHIDAIISATTFCMVPSELRDQKEAWNIVMERDDDPQDWYIRDGNNTLEVRLRRLERFITAAADLGLIDNSMMSDSHLQKEYHPFNPAEFLAGYLAYWDARKDADPDGYAEAASAAKRLAAAGPVQSTGLPLALELIRRAARSLTKRGLRRTARRGLQWAQLRSHKRGRMPGTSGGTHKR